MASSCPSPEVIAALVGGELDPARRAAIDEHLGDCAACRRVVSALLGADVTRELEIRPGTLWASRYVVGEALGKGASSRVFRAFDQRLSRSVALKVARGSADPGARARWRREAQAGARLDHPYVAPIYDMGEYKGHPYIAMAWIPGESIRSWLRGGPRKVEDIVRVFARAAAGLGAAHEAGLLHRDFKPENVMLDDASGVPRIIDFGLARSADEAEAAVMVDGDLRFGDEETNFHTKEGVLCGTPRYLSPELLDGGRPSAASDQFAFCVALFEALAEAPPFGGHTLQALRRAQSQGPAALPERVPAWLEAVVRRGLAFDPADRFPSMNALARALEPPAEQPQPWRKLAVIGVAAALLSAVLVGLLVSGRGGKPLVDGRARFVAGDELGVAAAFAAIPHPAAAQAWLTVDEELRRFADELAETGAQAGGKPEIESCLAVSMEELQLVSGQLRRVDRDMMLRRLPEIMALLGEPAGCLVERGRPHMSPEASALRAQVVGVIAGGLGRGGIEQRPRLVALRAQAHRLVLPTIEATLAIAEGTLLSRHGSPAEALAVYEQAVTAAEAGGATVVRLRAYTAMVRLNTADKAVLARLAVLSERASAMIAQQAPRPWLAADLLQAQAIMAEAAVRLEEAEGLYRRAALADLAVWGPESLMTARVWASLARVCKRLGRRDEARQVARQALPVLVRDLGPTHGEVFDMRRLLIGLELSPAEVMPAQWALLDELVATGHEGTMDYLRQAGAMMEILGVEPSRPDALRLGERLLHAAEQPGFLNDARLRLCTGAAQVAVNEHELDLGRRAMACIRQYDVQDPEQPERGDPAQRKVIDDLSRLLACGERPCRP